MSRPGCSSELVSPHTVYIVGQNSFCIWPLKVLSSSVSKALELTGGSEVEETAKLTATFNKFFDALNVRNFSDECTKRKPFQLPYHSKDDCRLKANKWNYTL